MTETKRAPATKAKKSPAATEEDLSERTVVTQISVDELSSDSEAEKAYILFISGQLMGKLCLLDKKETIIGRGPDCDIHINDTRISRIHLRISIGGNQAVIEDMGSTNGTFVNGTRVKTHVLQNGDQVHISSDTLFNFAWGKEADLMFHDAMHKMANYDAVTGIHNKHVFERRLKEEFSYAKRNALPLSLLMIDIDFFKKVNDTHGHMAGDYVLQGVARRIRGTVRDEDILARYGGEEFVTILRGTDKAGALLMAERIRALVASEPFVFEKKSIPVTISIGVASLPSEAIGDVSQFIAHSDACLYRSKEDGRNRVTA